MRKQRPRGTTTREAVVAAALKVVDDAGLEGLTIRAVATKVGAPPMSLYAHFTNKEQLLDLMYTEVAHRMYADTRHPTWQMELTALCHQIRALLRQHPRWIPLLSRPAHGSSVPLRERLLKMMVSEGMSPELALTSVSSGIVVTIGLVLTELNLRDPEGQPAVAKRFERLRGWLESNGAADSPITLAAMTKTKKLDLDAIHAFTIRALIAGVAQQQAN